MGQFQSGKWLLLLSIYFFAMFLIVTYTINAAESLGLQTGTIDYSPDTEGNINELRENYCSDPERTAGYCLMLVNSENRNNNTIQLFPACYCDPSSSECSQWLGKGDYLCGDFNETQCNLAQYCEWVGEKGIIESVNLDDRVSMSNFVQAFSFITSINAGNVDLGIPLAFNYIFSFIFFWIPAIMFLWSLYMALPFVH